MLTAIDAHNNLLVLFVKDVQQKMKPYILAIDMSIFKYDDFLSVLNTVNQYVSIGLESQYLHYKLHR